MAQHIEEESAYERLARGPVPNILYYVAYGLSMVMLMFNFIRIPAEATEGVATVSGVLEVVIIVLLGAKLVMRRPSAWGILLCAGLVALAVAARILSITVWFFWIVVFVISAEGVRLRDLAKVFLGVMSAIVVVTIVGMYQGVFTDFVATRSDGGTATSVIRHSLGFNHPNTFAACLFGICTAFAIVTFGMNPLPTIAVDVAAAIACKLVADSRTAVYVIALEVVLLLVFHFVKNARARKVIGILMICMVAAAVAVSLYLMAAFDPSRPLDALLDRIISSRFALAHWYYGMKPLTLLGQSYGDVPPTPEGYVFIVDDSYCRMAMENGIIPTGLFLAGCFGTLINEVRKGAWSPVLFGLTLMLVYATTENYLMQINFNFCLVAIGSDFLYQEGSVLVRRAARWRRGPEPDDRQLNGRHMRRASATHLEP